MGGKLDDLLRALPAPGDDHRLDQLEPLVWRRIERSGREASVNGLTVRLQVAVAVCTLCLGVALGWSQGAGAPPLRQQTPLLLTHAELALVTGLGAPR